MTEHSYSADQRAAVYRVIEERRDVRGGFRPDPIPPEVLTRVLAAAHQAPSVGLSQPWDFIVIASRPRRERIKALADRARGNYAASLPGARALAFDRLKTEAILETPVNIVVTCDPTRGGRHTLGRQTQPQTAAYSSVLAVANLWLAARAEGLGVGWVSFFGERELATELGLPAHLEVVAYLCLGYVTEFAAEPELASAGWARRRPLAWSVHAEEYGQRGLPGQDAPSLLDEVRAAIGPLDSSAMAAARDRLDRMTKPQGSLGALEEMSVRLAGLAGCCPPPMPEPAAVAIFAADHGVHAQGVTPWPQEVTAQMVANFLAGGAVVNAFAAQAGAEVVVVDVGVCAELDHAPGLLPRKIAPGTADFTAGPAMTIQQAEAAISVGAEVARDLVAAGNRLLAHRRHGDRQHHGLRRARLRVHRTRSGRGDRPRHRDRRRNPCAEGGRGAPRAGRAPAGPGRPVGVLAAFGGFEHAALAGFILGAAALRVPVILDGMIAGAAALAAAALAPAAVDCCVAGHRSAEPGHAVTLDHLGLHPLIDLELRLGEGTGALLALPIAASAVRALREVATFDSAGVTDKSG